MILTFASDDSDFGTDGDSENDVEELE